MIAAYYVLMAALGAWLILEALIRDPSSIWILAVIAGLWWAIVRIGRGGDLPRKID